MDLKLDLSAVPFFAPSSRNGRTPSSTPSSSSPVEVRSLDSVSNVASTRTRQLNKTEEQTVKGRRSSDGSRGKSRKGKSFSSKNSKSPLSHSQQARSSSQTIQNSRPGFSNDDRKQPRRNSTLHSYSDFSASYQGHRKNGSKKIRDGVRKQSHRTFRQPPFIQYFLPNGAHERIEDAPLDMDSNLSQFFRHVTPLIPRRSFSSTIFGENVGFYTLEDLWNFYDLPFGIDVPLIIRGHRQVVTFVPFLSALDLHILPGRALPKELGMSSNLSSDFQKLPLSSPSTQSTSFPLSPSSRGGSSLGAHVINTSDRFDGISLFYESLTTSSTPPAGSVTWHAAAPIDFSMTSTSNCLPFSASTNETRLPNLYNSPSLGGSDSDGKYIPSTPPLGRSPSSSAKIPESATSRSPSMTSNLSFVSPPLCFRFNETLRPDLRVPLMDKISILSSVFPLLLQARSYDLDPRSWFAIAWYPVISQADTASHIRGNFITYHQFSPKVLKLSCAPMQNLRRLEHLSGIADPREPLVNAVDSFAFDELYSALKELGFANRDSQCSNRQYPDQSTSPARQTSSSVEMQSRLENSQIEQVDNSLPHTLPTLQCSGRSQSDSVIDARLLSGISSVRRGSIEYDMNSPESGQSESLPSITDDEYFLTSEALTTQTRREDSKLTEEHLSRSVCGRLESTSDSSPYLEEDRKPYDQIGAIDSCLYAPVMGYVGHKIQNDVWYSSVHQPLSLLAAPIAEEQMSKSASCLGYTHSFMRSSVGEMHFCSSDRAPSPAFSDSSVASAPSALLRSPNAFLAGFSTNRVLSGPLYLISSISELLRRIDFQHHDFEHCLRQNSSLATFLSATEGHYRQSADDGNPSAFVINPHSILPPQSHGGHGVFRSPPRTQGSNMVSVSSSLQFEPLPPPVLSTSKRTDGASEILFSFNGQQESLREKDSYFSGSTASDGGTTQFRDADSVSKHPFNSSSVRSSTPFETIENFDAESILEGPREQLGTSASSPVSNRNAPSPRLQSLTHSSLNPGPVPSSLAPGLISFSQNGMNFVVSPNNLPVLGHPQIPSFARHHPNNPNSFVLSPNHVASMGRYQTLSFHPTFSSGRAVPPAYNTPPFLTAPPPFTMFRPPPRPSPILPYKFVDSQKFS